MLGLVDFPVGLPGVFAEKVLVEEGIERKHVERNECPVASSVSGAFPVGSGGRTTGLPFATRSEVIACNGIAATSQPLATQVALDILKDGGNAVDAAIAANIMLGLVEPTGSGIGGDIFAIVWDNKSQKLYGLNGSGRSPYTLSLDNFKEMGLARVPSHGPLSVTVPGCVDGWYELHDRFGRMSMSELFEPTILYAREGFPVTELIAHHWQIGHSVLKDCPGFLDTYSINGRPPKKGEIFRNPALADTLEKISKGGRDVFYDGEIAVTIETFMRRSGGFLTYQDLVDHRSDWVEPVSTNYRGLDVWELPPNGQGITALQILNILEGFDLRAWGFGSKEHLHHFIEAKKLAFEDRARFCADPDFNDIPVKELISKEYAARLRKLIDPGRAAKSCTMEDPVLKEGDTVYLTTADGEGNMVSLIQSNIRGMGSGMIPTGLGFMLQNRGELFSLEEGRFNSYVAGKRPFHTIIPGFITKDGKPYLSFGVMGGDMQPQGHAQVVVNIVDFGMNIQEAGDAPRVRHEGSSDPTGGTMTDGGVVCLESGFPEETVQALQNLGHRIVDGAGGFGGYQAIMYDHSNRVYYGASESRKDGQAAGF